MYPLFLDLQPPDLTGFLLFDGFRVIGFCLHVALFGHWHYLSLFSGDGPTPFAPSFRVEPHTGFPFVFQPVEKYGLTQIANGGQIERTSLPPKV